MTLGFATTGNQRVMIDCDQSQDFVAGEYPDGMAIDKFGYIWVAMYAGGRVVKIDVDTGEINTSLCFLCYFWFDAVAKGLHMRIFNLFSSSR